MSDLYADEDFVLPAVKELRRLGHNVLTAFEAGNANQGTPDRDVLEFATFKRRILLSFNRKDFVKLHQSHAAHAGIVICTRDLDTQRLARNIDRQLALNVQCAGKLIRVTQKAGTAKP